MKLFSHSFFNLLHIILFILHQVLLWTHESDSLFPLYLSSHTDFLPSEINHSVLCHSANPSPLHHIEPEFLASFPHKILTIFCKMIFRFLKILIPYFNLVLWCDDGFAMYYFKRKITSDFGFYFCLGKFLIHFVPSFSV